MKQIDYAFNTAMLDRTIMSNGVELSSDKLGFQKKIIAIQFKEIKKIEIKKVGMTAGANVRLLLHYERDGKKQIFPDKMGIEALRNDQNLLAFLAELRERAPQAELRDKTQTRTSSNKDTSYNIAPSILGVVTALPNWLSLGIMTICFSPLLFSIPLGIYAISKGYRILIKDEGLVIKKIMGKDIAWEQIAGIQFVHVKLQSTSNQELGDLLEFEIRLKNNKSVKFFARFDEAKSLEKIFREKGLMLGDYEQAFAI